MRKAKEKRRRPSVTIGARRTYVSRREYAEVVARLGALELQIRRNRLEFEAQLARIAQMQAELDALTKAAVTPAAAELPPLPLPVKTTVES